jgi:hypothetical protein
MSLIEDIANLMLREGEIKGQAAREQIAEQEEMRQSKHRLLKNTLKGLAMFGPMFLPGGGLWGALSGGGDREFLDPSQNPNILVQHRAKPYMEDNWWTGY